MKLIFTFLLITSTSFLLFSQKGDFPFGKITYKELEMNKYEPDTSAAAVVLSEFGKARFNDNVDLVFDYHVKIKVLKKEGLEKGNFAIVLRKEGNVVDKEETWISLEATTFNKESNGIKESKFDPKNFILEKFNKNYNIAKFALPDVRVGSVIEVKYSTHSPYWYQFHTWEFQDDIPKIYSEFWSYIPANFTYSITLKGFYKLTKTSVEEVTECFRMPGAGGASPNSDCSLGKYVMENLPAFKEEKYMTAKRNFLSAIHFELSQIIESTGAKTNYAEEWKDVDQKLKVNDYFGLKIKKAKKLMEDIVGPLVSSESDALKKAKNVYDYFQKWYSWNSEVEKYSDKDVKQIHDNKKGSSADINLSLIGALQSIGLNADPVLVSTRDHGTPFKGHPQRTDFNYVVSSLKIGDQLYLLDATDPYLPFGVLPMRCINDQGRLVSKDESAWIDLVTNQKQKTAVSMDLKWTETGELNGQLKIQYFGYDAVDQRKKISSATEEEYLKSLTKDLHEIELTNYKSENKADISQPLIEKMEIQLEGLERAGASVSYFNPFIFYRYDKNPFQSAERLYPVDLGSPIEQNYFVSIEMPDGVALDEAPKSLAFTLPNGGGKCLFNVTIIGKKIAVTFVMSLNKAVYTSEEYHYLKEFFARVVQIQQSQFVFKKKL